MQQDNNNEINITDLGKAVLNIYGKQTIIKLMTRIRQLDKVASGKMINSLNWNLRQFIGAFQMELEGEKHAVFVLQGRLPGKYVPVKSLQAWMRIKNIPLKYTFPINKKIFKFGIKPANFIDEILNQRSLDDLGNELEKNYEIELDKMITKYFIER